MPAFSQIEKVNAHEDIVQTHPQLNLILRKQPTDCWEQNGHIGYIGNFLHEMYHHIHTEEREQEPHRRISVEMALQPYVAPRQHIPVFMQFVGVTEKQAKLRPTTYCAPCQIRNTQTLELILQAETGRSGNTFVEIPRLEKEETDKEESPRHQFIEPKRTASKSTHADTMQRNHPKNTKPAKQVKSMISSFHAAKV